jgi:hypothetical protein
MLRLHLAIRFANGYIPLSMTGALNERASRRTYPYPWLALFVAALQELLGAAAKAKGIEQVVDGW